VVDAAITFLEGQLAIERLGVVDHGLRFNAGAPVPLTGDRVPRAKVAGVGKRHLRVPPQARVQLAPEPIEKAGVPSVADSIARWE